ncbi:MULTISPECIES: SIR2 family protein [Alcanivorax]|uniref:SIR2 family protein n=1 Tax=Alcanivorax TaxID=59753 RepID=UPI0018F426A4
MVFSEEGYHQIYGEAYHWSNLVQLASLKETTCLMVGLSLSDPNLRRLLEIAAKSLDRPRHYAFMQRIGLEKFKKESGRNVVRAPVSISKRFLDRHHSLNEEVMRELGVNVIWYEEYDEIPRILQKIGMGV